MKNTKTAPAVDREELRREYAKVWGNDSGMIEYCTKEAAQVALLPGGELLPVKKQKINTRFCFGESGYDYENAMASARYAETSSDYFKEQNMSAFSEYLHELDSALNGDGDYTVCVRLHPYCSQTEDCRIVDFSFLGLWEVLDSLGGSARLSDLPGTVFSLHGSTYRIATAEELQIIRDAYAAAAAAHEKKVDAYLKRYGLSNVHAWTYWRDA